MPAVRKARPSALIADGFLRADPIVYEDFLPVSAAGIFQSNLDDTAAEDARPGGARRRRSRRHSVALSATRSSCTPAAQAESLRSARATLSAAGKLVP